MQWMRRTRTARWAGLITSLVIVAVFVMSLWCSVRWVYAPGRELAVFAGGIGAGWEGPGKRVGPPTQIRGYLLPGPGVYWMYSEKAVLTYALAPSIGDAVFYYVGAPLWMPFLLVATPTALLWRADRRRVKRARAGACAACGYDLRGAAPGSQCPECGGGAGTAARTVS